MLTLKGTPFLYNGEEIGMADLELTSLSQVRDTTGINQYHVMTETLEHTARRIRAVFDGLGDVDLVIAAAELATAARSMTSNFAPGGSYPSAR